MDVSQPGAPRRQIKRSGIRTKAEAMEVIRKALERAETGRAEPSRLTLGAWLADHWLPSLGVRGSTRGTYESIVRNRIAPGLGDQPLRSITRSQVKAFYGSLGALSPKTVHNVHLVLHRALGAAVEDGLIPANPADHALRRPGRSAEMRTWSGDELRRFLAHAEREPDYALWRVLAMTGMRRGEALGLRWTDLNADGSVGVQRTLSRQGDAGVVLGEPKTARGRRRIPLDAATAQALRDHRGRQVIASVDGLMFTRADGRPMDPDVASQRFESLAAAAGLPRIRLHDLRHTHATLMLQAGVHPKVVSERLGHASVAITLDTYSHAIPSMGAEAADRVAALVDGGA